jgi:hypothetical protein
VSFKATDDVPLTDDGVALVLNGTRYTKANGLTLSGTGNSRTATFAKLEANRNYNAFFEVTDAGGITTREQSDFDTFTGSVLVIESEDYNFSGGFIDKSLPIAEGGGPQSDSYANQAGVQGVDFNDTRTAPRSQDAPWRNQDAVRMERTLDLVRSKFVAAGGTAAEVYDYVVGDIDAGEWLNYTRTVPPGSYEVYLRQALINMEAGESVLEQVTSDPTQPGQTVKTLGSFLGTLSGFTFRNTPLTEEQEISNTAKSRVRARVEHVFGHMQNSMGGIFVRSIGIARAKVGVTLMNLTYNLRRIEVLIRNKVISIDRVGASKICQAA